MIKKYTLIASTILGTALLSPAVSAQDIPSNLENIFVTATKREQTLQDVPIAVSAYTGELLRNAGVTDVRELIQLSPSLFLSSSASEAAGAVARIRGIGTTGDNPGLESSVAIFIDGVYRNRTNVGLTELGPLERVEVLRGPQGTLFGRNASAGLINIVTARPDFDPSGYAELSYGNYDFLRIGAGVTGALVDDKIAARIDGIYHSRDGFLKDATTGEDINDRDRYLIRSKVFAEFDGGGSLLLSFDYANRDETCCAAVTTVRGATAPIIEALGERLGSGGTPEGSDPYDRISATTPGRSYQQDIEEWGISAELNWDFDSFSFVSITAYRDWQANRGQDIDYTSADILYRDFDGSIQNFETFTQEFRVNGKWGILDWMVGAFYGNEDLLYDDAIRHGDDYQAYANLLATSGTSALVPFGNFSAFLASQGLAALAPLAPGELAIPGGSGGVQDIFQQNSENWSIFTHNIINVSELIDVTLGVRYTQERKTLNADLTADNQACTDLVTFLNTPVPGAGGASVNAVTGGALDGLQSLACLPFTNPFVDGTYQSDRKETEFTGTAAVNFKWTDDFSTYISYSRGYKAGGFNLDRGGFNPSAPNADTDLQFEQETVDSFEIGTKYRNPDLNFSLNGAIFYAEFTDFQLNTFDGISFIVENLPSVESYGVEVDGTWSPIDTLNINGGLTYVSAEYGDFDPLPALTLLPGQTLTNAPELSVSTSISYQPPINDDLKGIFYIDGRYTSEINTGSNLAPEKLQEGFLVVNGRVGLGDIDDRWRVEIFARNIFDKEYVQVVFDAPLQEGGFNAFLAEPRMFGVNVRGKF